MTCDESQDVSSLLALIEKIFEAQEGRRDVLIQLEINMKHIRVPLTEAIFVSQFHGRRMIVSHR